MAPESKSELLKDKVVDLVKKFVENEGGISQIDLERLFGNYNLSAVSSALAALPICWVRR